MTEPSKEAFKIAGYAQAALNFAAHIHSQADIALAIDALCAKRLAKVTAQRDRLKKAITPALDELCEAFDDDRGSPAFHAEDLPSVKKARAALKDVAI